MKKCNGLILLVSGLLVFTSSLAQKDSSGIYKTLKDFQQRKLSYAINYKTERHRINSGLLFNNDNIKVTHDNKSYTLLKNETYGYRSVNGEEFRFIDNKEYRIINPGQDLMIYVYKHSSHSPKDTEKYAPTYFFSTDAASAPQSLTKANVKAAYPGNHKFHDDVDAGFKNDSELYSYDQFHKMYKLNRMLKSGIN